jgi:hypothetical protein
MRHEFGPSVVGRIDANGATFPGASQKCRLCSVIRVKTGTAWHYRNAYGQHLGTGLHNNCRAWPCVPKTESGEPK